jgi:asparagine synthase (glutamine-hydrolysing)
MSMSASLELRVPFVDQRFYEVARRVSLDWKLEGGKTKGLFRRAVADLLPEAIVRAPKLGLNLPIAPWMQGHLAGWTAERLDALAQDGWIDGAQGHALLAEHRAGKRDHSLILWACAALAEWSATA